MPEPIVPDSYWVTDALAAGEYPGATTEAAASAKVARFESAGITMFVDLTHPTDGLEPYEPHLALAQRAHHPIVDNDIPTVAEMTATLDSIDAALAGGETVYVHCWGGIGRTGTVVGCWLVRHGRTYDEAIDLIRELRRRTPDYRWQPDSPQTSAQHLFVREWAEQEGAVISGPDTPGAVPPLADGALERLLRFLPIFDAPGFVPGVARGGKDDGSGVIQWPWVEYVPAVNDFHHLLYEDGWIFGFDWPSWQQEGRAVMAGDGIESAELDTLRRLLTVIVRKERFSDGTLDVAFRQGAIVRILRRVAQLNDL